MSTELNAKREGKYFCEIRAINDDKWYGNIKVYDTFDEAKEWADAILLRWMATTDSRVRYRENGIDRTVTETV